jgi:hypothetical protein
MGKSIALIILSVSLAGVLAALFYRYVPGKDHSPKSVWISYSEKYRDADPARRQDYEEAKAGDGLFAEERLMWRIKEDTGCIVLTHDRRRADYIAAISVVRLIGGGNMYGEASLSIQKANGEVVTADHFYQNPKSQEDIAQQPVTALWQTLCGKRPQR